MKGAERKWGDGDCYLLAHVDDKWAWLIKVDDHCALLLHLNAIVKSVQILHVSHIYKVSLISSH